MMSLYLLELREDLQDYDCALGFVVRSDSEQHARELATVEAGEWDPRGAWMDPLQTTCTVLPIDGAAGVLLASKWPG